ncbi:hypothetical protein EHS25_002653 [Saitozyma podzolica]|uniref:Uncharacterized protein n=1 Tax=Saitozyma podzolica TaxID=1890683 RepID=A0A427YCV0_9TREE|nr:hypothetical protein EHS25_002653 [Saitozyma podzolica]
MSNPINIPSPSPSSRRSSPVSSVGNGNGNGSTTTLVDAYSPPETKIKRVISGPNLDGQFELSEDYQHLAAEPAEFDKVIKQRMAKLQDRLPQLNDLKLRQARADIVYLRAIVSGEDSSIAQARAGAAYSAAH